MAFLYLNLVLRNSDHFASPHCSTSKARRCKVWLRHAWKNGNVPVAHEAVAGMVTVLYRRK